MERESRCNHSSMGASLRTHRLHTKDGVADMVSQLLISDGAKSRYDRKALLNPEARNVGVACGTHPSLGRVAVITLSALFYEHDEPAAGTSPSTVACAAGAAPSDAFTALLRSLPSSQLHDQVGWLSVSSRERKERRPARLITALHRTRAGLRRARGTRAGTRHQVGEALGAGCAIELEYLVSEVKLTVTKPDGSAQLYGIDLSD